MKNRSRRTPGAAHCITDTENLVKTTIEVKDRKEGDAIRAALADPETRAQVVVYGMLVGLSERARSRVLTFVTDKLSEDGAK
jgi:hypothetical protein